MSINDYLARFDAERYRDFIMSFVRPATPARKPSRAHPETSGPRDFRGGDDQVGG